MIIFKCKMCGGDVQAEEGATFGTCGSCGVATTLPKASDERKANLLNRANHFRRLNEFDKALQAYENILNEDNADAEAHWGVVLSRYGIEYVEDPVTHQRVPTCHRVQSDSIFADADYLAALEYAPDGFSRSLYEDEAKRISEIQKGILAISSKEEPYDVFICYKETTEGGSRTKDSAIAQDIYYHLTNDGYRVFFAKITLEDKLGVQYEPYIFSALNSAKVMLVIGTRKEHFEAVWVKNEWSRFLAIMKKDRSRLLIPCYRDMDAYDIPDELSNLQSQDMSKVGFIQDILRGVKKVLDASKSIKVAGASLLPKPAIMSVAPGIESLMKRGWLFLEDSDWEHAVEYFDKVLDIDPEYAPAYVGKLCEELNVRQEESLGDCKNPISDMRNFQKAIRFADVSYQVTLKGYDKKIRERIREDEYNRLVERYKEASTEHTYFTLAQQFRAMNGYKNTTALADDCDNQYRIIKERREERMRETSYSKLGEPYKNASTEREYHELAQQFRALNGYKNTAELANECENQYQILKKRRELAEKVKERHRKIGRIVAPILALLSVILFWSFYATCRGHGGPVLLVITTIMICGAFFAIFVGSQDQDTRTLVASGWIMALVVLLLLAFSLPILPLARFFGILAIISNLAACIIALVFPKNNPSTPPMKEGVCNNTPLQNDYSHIGDKYY